VGAGRQLRLREHIRLLGLTRQVAPSSRLLTAHRTNRSGPSLRGTASSISERSARIQDVSHPNRQGVAEVFGPVDSDAEEPAVRGIAFLAAPRASGRLEWGSAHNLDLFGLPYRPETGGHDSLRGATGSVDDESAEEQQDTTGFARLLAPLVHTHPSPLTRAGRRRGLRRATRERMRATARRLRRSGRRAREWRRALRRRLRRRDRLSRRLRSGPREARRSTR
jgi:hypothetical protein